MNGAIHRALPLVEVLSAPEVTEAVGGLHASRRVEAWRSRETGEFKEVSIPARLNIPHEQSMESVRIPKHTLSSSH
jgi:hypothetical protein